MPPPDRVRLQHMLDAAQRVQRFVFGKSRTDLDADDPLGPAVVRLLEVIGEAAKAVSQPTRDTMPSVPWRLIGRTRDRLIHGYFNVDMDIVWQIVTVDHPPLITELEAALAVP